MLTSADEPKLCVPKMQIKNADQKDSSIIKGFWNSESKVISIYLSKKAVKFGVNRSKRKEMIVNKDQIYNIVSSNGMIIKIN